MLASASADGTTQARMKVGRRSAIRRRNDTGAVSGQDAMDDGRTRAHAPCLCARALLCACVRLRELCRPIIRPPLPMYLAEGGVVGPLAQAQRRKQK